MDASTAPLQERRSQLAGRYGFVCRCERCLEEERRRPQHAPAPAPNSGAASTGSAGGGCDVGAEAEFEAAADTVARASEEFLQQVCLNNSASVTTSVASIKKRQLGGRHGRARLVGRK